MNIIYTVVTNNYDQLHPVEPVPGWRYLCFTDNLNMSSRGWELVKFRDQMSGKLLSRKPKILFYQYLPAHEYSIYVDANIRILSHPDELIKRFPHDWTIWRHPSRNCIYDEAGAVVRLKKDTQGNVDNIVKFLKHHGYPANFGLSQNGIMIRKNEPHIKKLCGYWWDVVSNYSHRDQLSLHYIFWKHNFKPTQPAEPWQQHFAIEKHMLDRGDFNLYEFVPYGRNKDLGAAINMHCEIVPSPEDWIIIRDGDTMWQHFNWGDQVRACIDRYPDTGLFSCYTNRLGLDYQLHNRHFSDNDSIRHHRKIAYDLAEKYWDECEVTDKPTAGLLMVFKKSTWMRNPFREGGIVQPDGRYIDYFFAKGILDMGLKIRLMKGVYLLHYYRMLEMTTENNLRYTKHLI